MGPYAFCDDDDDSESKTKSKSRNGEVLLCNYLLDSLIVSSGGNPLIARAASNVDQTRKVEHYPTVP